MYSNESNKARAQIVKKAENKRGDVQLRFCPLFRLGQHELKPHLMFGKLQHFHQKVRCQGYGDFKAKAMSIVFGRDWQAVDQNGPKWTRNGCQASRISPNESHDRSEAFQADPVGKDLSK